MGTPNKDIVIKDDAPSELLLDKHMDFLVSYSEKKNDYEYVVTGRMEGLKGCVRLNCVLIVQKETVTVKSDKLSTVAVIRLLWKGSI